MLQYHLEWSSNDWHEMFSSGFMTKAGGRTMRLARSTRKRYDTTGKFTLIELLVVIGIMGILMYISLPSFEKILVGSGVDFATRNMISNLGMTRNYAIATRQYVALLMPTADLPDQYCYSSYRMCIVGSTGAYSAGVTTYTFQKWIQGETWEFMNVGSAITHLDNVAGYAASTLAYEQVDGVKCGDIGVSSPINGVRAVVFKPTGKIACNNATYGDRFVTVGEGAYTAGALLRKNMLNEINIKIEKYTGRISYGSN